MSPGSIVVLVGSVTLVFGTAITVLCSLALLWAYSKLRPVETLQAEISGQRAMIETLEAQVIRLRTQKAGLRSAQKKADMAPPPEEEDDPLLAGLTPEEKAMFAGIR